MSTYPLANDEEGNVVEVPALASGWLVRRHGGGRGRPGVVYDRAGGTLIVRLDATAEDLRAAGCGPGMYRLDAVDAARRLLNVTAYTEVLRPPDEQDPAAAAVSAPRDAEIAAFVRICEAMQRTQAEQIRASVERERNLLTTIEKLSQSEAPTRIEKLRNAHTEDTEVRAFLRDALDAERRAARAAKPVRAPRRQAVEPVTPWPAIIGSASSLVAIAATVWGEKLGVTPEQRADIVRITDGLPAMVAGVVAAQPVGESPADDDQDGDDDNHDGQDDDQDDDDQDDDDQDDDDQDDDDQDDDDQDDDDQDDDDDDDGAEDDDSDVDDREDNAETAPDPNAQRSIRATLRALTMAGDVRSMPLKRKLRDVLALLTPAERQVIASNLARVPKPILVAQLREIETLTSAQVLGKFRALLAAFPTERH